MSIKLVDTKDFRPDVAIVGGGASGTLLAAHLLRAGGARVVLIERGDRMGRGVAYGTGYAGHLLNVPAASMSGIPEDPEHFLRFAREHHDCATEPTTFVPRTVYGAYLEWLLAESEQRASPSASLLRWQGDVVDIAGGLLTFADGRRLSADRVVLALGNLPPRAPA
ncbi:MAG: FAD/NAD(P)-binding protein, partial [Actinomycetota bacterium]|nr:FAD/NAD(P)-binding protein [Actinomycetota bacterium]